jgi:hypothetical protein
MGILWLKIIGFFALSILAIWALHRLLLWMERKDWIYYRRKPAKESMHSVLGGFQGFIEPEIHHVQEDQRQRAASPADKDPSER